MNLDDRLAAIVESVLRFEARLATVAEPIARILDAPPTSPLRRRRYEWADNPPAVAPSQTAA